MSVFSALYKTIPGSLRRSLKSQFLYKIISKRRILIEEAELDAVFEKGLDFLKEKQGLELGDYLEFGVYNGTSISLMDQVLQKKKIKTMRLFGFDSFEGLPALEENDSNSKWFEGQFKCDYSTTLDRLNKRGVQMDRLSLIKGFFSDSLTEVLKEEKQMQKASVIMIDCDMYSSTLEALEFSVSLILDQCVVIFDDWYPLAHKNQGEKKAFDDFLKAHPEFMATPFNEYQYFGRKAGKVFILERLT